MPSTYDIGDQVRVTGTFTDTGLVVGDPSAVNFLFDTPTSTAPTVATRTSTSTGVVGGICIILFLYSVQTIPVNIAGMLLIIFSAVLFLLEIKIASYGLLTIGGVVSLALGSLMLVDSPLPFLQISWKLILAATITITLFFLFAFLAHVAKEHLGEVVLHQAMDKCFAV